MEKKGGNLVSIMKQKPAALRRFLKLISRSCKGECKNICGCNNVQSAMEIAGPIFQMKLISQNRVTVTFRKIRNINVNLFMADINKSKLVVNPSNELENLTHQYYDVLSGHLDTHAPKITRSPPGITIIWEWKREKIGVVRGNG